MINLKIFFKDKETLSTGKINLRTKRGFPNSVCNSKTKGWRVLGEHTTGMKTYLETRSFCYVLYKQQKARSLFLKILLFINR